MSIYILNMENPSIFICNYCKILNKQTISLHTSCVQCHELYWRHRDMLTIEQNEEIQLCGLYKKDYPQWFCDWWIKINKFKAFE